MSHETDAIEKLRFDSYAEDISDPEQRVKLCKTYLKAKGIDVDSYEKKILSLSKEYETLKDEVSVMTHKLKNALDNKSFEKFNDTELLDEIHARGYEHYTCEEIEEIKNLNEYSHNELLEILNRRSGMEYVPEDYIPDFSRAIEYYSRGDVSESLYQIEKLIPELDGIHTYVRNYVRYKSNV